VVSRSGPRAIPRCKPNHPPSRNADYGRAPASALALFAMEGGRTYFPPLTVNLIRQDSPLGTEPLPKPNRSTGASQPEGLNATPHQAVYFIERRVSRRSGEQPLPRVRALDLGASTRARRSAQRDNASSRGNLFGGLTDDTTDTVSLSASLPRRHSRPPPTVHVELLANSKLAIENRFVDAPVRIPKSDGCFHDLSYRHLG
jgi:hypothetical protein